LEQFFRQNCEKSPDLKMRNSGRDKNYAWRANCEKSPSLGGEVSLEIALAE